MTRLLLLTPVFLLIGCINAVTDRDRRSMVAMTAPDLAACAGKPNQAWKIGPDDWIWQYEQAAPTQAAVTLKTGFPALSELDVGARGTCHAVIRLHGGYVASIHFTGPSLTVSGANGACVPLIHECVTRSDMTKLPDGYHIDEWMPK